MNCRDTIRLICEYLEGRLAPPVAGEMLNHIDRCQNCKVVLEAAERTLEVYFDRVAQPARPRQQVA
ncbi:MAG TPA: zf-HC2 domain-containing protein [Methylomirabilota bacterium]|nr:zf-HC2 domain-containing protein [Methylomirabilota bacterium]